ncbi:MAG: hypothetical protein ACKO92_02365 [Actinomycetota bacterium]
MRRFALALVAVMSVVAGCGSGASTPVTSAGSGAGDLACPEKSVADQTAITPERSNLLIGFSERNAELCADELGWAFRVGMRDGESYPLTADYSLQRVTVVVQDDIVIEVAVG